MKKKIVSRMLSIMLAGVMMVSVVACGVESDEKEQKSEEASKTSPASKETESAVGSEEAELEPITLTWGIRDVNIKEAGIPSEKSEIWKYIEEEFGITIDFVTYDAEKYNLLVNGNDLPDIIQLYQSAANVNDIIASGQLLPLDDLLAEYGQNITKNISLAIEEVNESYDAVYMLPTGVEGQSNVPRQNGYFGAFAGRYDVYKAIGSPEMNGLDSFLDVAKQMQEFERERTGNENIYAFAFYLNNSLGSSIPSFALGWEYMSPALEFNLSTYEVRNAFLDPESSRWEVFEIFNTAYRMGIFDPDSFTMDVNRYNEKASAGEMLFNLTWGHSVGEEVAVPGYEEYATTLVLPGTGLDYNAFICSRISPLGYTSDSARAINANCEYPERAMQLLNWLDSTEGARMLFAGKEGESWEYVDGVPQYTDAVFEAQENGTIGDYWLQNRLCGYGTNGMCSGELAVITEDGYPGNLAYSEENFIRTASDINKAVAADFGCEYIGQVYAKWVEEGIMSTDKYSDEYAKKIAACKKAVSALPTEYVEINNNTTNYFTSHIAEVITAESPEAFEQIKASIIDEMTEMGLEQCYDYITSAIAYAYE